jgi:hypothetical protein
MLRRVFLDAASILGPQLRDEKCFKTQEVRPNEKVERKSLKIALAS